MKKLLLFFASIIIILNTNQLIRLLNLLNESYYNFSNTFIISMSLLLYGICAFLIYFIIWQNVKITQKKEISKHLLTYNKENEILLQHVFLNVENIKLTQSILDKKMKNEKEELHKLLNKNTNINQKRKFI